VLTLDKDYRGLTMTGPYGGYQPPSHDTYPHIPAQRQPGPPIRPAVPLPAPPVYRPGVHPARQPVWAPAGPGGYVPPPRRGRKVFWLVLGGVTLVVLALAAVFVVPALLSAGTDSKTTISVPPKAGGLTKQTNPGELGNVSLTDPSLKHQVSAVYQGAAGTQPVYLFGGTATDFAPATELDTFFRQLNDAGLTISDRKSFDDGPLDGRLDCATATTQAQPFATCAWANHGALVATLSPKQTPAQLAKTTQSMLPDVVTLG
jgi:hypothetical protein